MDIPVGVEVICEQEVCGESKALVINPTNERITHVVVAEKEYPHAEHLVPLDTIIESTPSSIRLRCSCQEFGGMEPFHETEFIKSGDVTLSLPYDEPYFLWPYTLYDKLPMPIEHDNIPADKIVIRRGTPVMAVDGHIGTVDEFLVNPENGTISHLVMRESHLWNAKDVTIPVSEIKDMEDGVIILKLNKQEISRLPSVAVRRSWN